MGAILGQTTKVMNHLLHTKNLIHTKAYSILLNDMNHHIMLHMISIYQRTEARGNVIAALCDRLRTEGTYHV